MTFATGCYTTGILAAYGYSSAGAAAGTIVEDSLNTLASPKEREEFSVGTVVTIAVKAALAAGLAKVIDVLEQKTHIVSKVADVFNDWLTSGDVGGRLASGGAPGFNTTLGQAAEKIFEAVFGAKFTDWAAKKVTKRGK